ncbi:MAG: PA14 domain-containing protein, partial [Planctomycetota bacterium]|nr:PA14 domain-containing protein [Planctomycetota bacterium]
MDNRINNGPTFLAILGFAIISAAPLGGQDAPSLVTGPGLEVGGLSEGEMLLGELNCVGCHEAGDQVKDSLFVKQPPLLGDVGDRITPNYLRAFLEDPQSQKPGTGMPQVLHGMGRAARKHAIEDLVHYLSSLKSDTKAIGVEADGYLLETGKQLFHRVGCVACHEPQEEAKKGKKAANPADEILRQARARAAGNQADPASVPLGKLSTKTTAEQLAAFLMDPVSIRPSGRMPSLNLDRTEATAIAVYLLRDQLKGEGAKETKALPGLTYKYYHHNGTNKVADVEKLQPKKRGSVDRFTLGPKERNENMALVFTGLIRIDKPGKYKFFTKTDDGSALYIAGKQVVNNDGVHGGQERSGEIELTAGNHPIKVIYFNVGGPYVFAVYYQGPGLKKRNIPSSVLTHIGQAMKPVGIEKLEIDPERVARGSKLFARNCASCHALGRGREDVAPAARAAPLAQLRGKEVKGCLSEKVPGAAPMYSFSQSQRKALRKVLAGEIGGALAARDRLHRSFSAHNCYACHERGGLGGPSPRRFDYFHPSMEVDMGDEARVPPHLDSVGAKLRPEWLQGVLTNKGTIRPYMATRMPQFGEDNVGGLASLLVSLDLPKGEKEEPPPNLELLRPGRTLVGNKGLSCVTCHIYGSYNSLGIPAADLTQMTKRVRKEWFTGFLLDPQKAKPGTRMPQFWPEGKAVRTEILDGNTAEQIEAIWAYLSKGKSSKIPSGLRKVGNELIPDDEALIYRHFIQGGGPRAIGVGYPEEVNLAFDANSQRIAMIWKGGFIDASRHRNGRGQGFQGPLGQSVVKLVEGAPFATLENPESPWPSESGKKGGFKMGGYRLGKYRQPTFFYSF